MLEMWDRTRILITQMVVMLYNPTFLEGSTQTDPPDNYLLAGIHPNTILTTSPTTTETYIQYICSLAMHMETAANMCIPRKWRSPDPPSLKDWFRRIHKTAEIEELIHQAKDTPSKFNQI